MAKKTMMELQARVAELRKQANAIEVEAIRAALEENNWFVKRAAIALGWHATALARRLAKDGDLAAMGRAAAKMRKASGYRGGNPILSETSDT